MRSSERKFSLELARNERVEMLAGLNDRAARLEAMVRLLPEEDRRLVELVFVRGATHRAAASAFGLPPGVITRRVQRLRNQLASPTIRAIADHAQTLPPPARRIAEDHFFGRMSVTALGDKHGLTRRDVQAQLDFIRGWARALHRDTVRAATRASDARDPEKANS